MSNKLLDQKRSSLDVSESSSEDDDSRRESYLNKDGLAESYNSQEQSYSPDADSTSKPTPQSKENISGFKGSNNIYIKENSNEKNPVYQDYTEDKFSSLSSSKGGEYKSPEEYGSSEEEGTEAKLSSKYASDDYGQGVSGFKNRLVVGNTSDQGPTDFKRAHVRKLQQEREQELYSKAVRESADTVREKWLLEKAKRSLDAEDLVGDKDNERGEDKDKLSRIEEDERDRSYGQSGSKGKAIRDSDTGARFEKIKNQVRDLEKNLNSYTKSLTKSSIKQKDRSQNLDKVYGNFEESLKEAKDELEQSLNNRKGAYEERERDYNSRGFSADRNRSGKKETLGKSRTGHASSVTRSSKKARKSIEVGKQTRGPSSTYKKLQEEISRLNYQNELLRERLGEDEYDKPRKTAQPGPDIDREKDLIDTIERIKKKLRHSMADKAQNEKEQIISEIQEDAAAKSFGRNYTTLGVSHKDVFMRKTYGDTTYNKENTRSSYKGGTSAFRTYDGAGYSQKLTKSKR